LRRRPERDPAPIIIGGTIGFLALVIVLVLALNSLFGGGGSSSSGSTTGDSVDIAPGIRGKKAQIPPLPPGLAALSDYVEFDAKDDVPVSIGLPLHENITDASGVGFYTYFDSRWQRLTDAGVQTIEGKSVGQGDFTTVPKNLAVLRVLAQTYQLAGSLPSGGSLHPDAKVSIINPRDYVPAADGSLQGTATSVSTANVLLMPTVVGSSAETATIVNDLLKDDSLRAEHAKAIASLVKTANLDGIDLEYSSVDPDRGGDFSKFINALADQLHNDNKRLSLTLPPPTKGRQAYDWGGLGKKVDIIRVLPIADPVTYWQTMPASLTQIAQDVDPGKIMLVINPFSIDGTGDASRPIGYLQAMALAGEAAVREPNVDDIKPGITVKLVAKNLDQAEGASPLQWSDDAAAVTFALGGNDRRRLFIENSFSVSFKLQLVQAFRLGGVAVADASAQSDVANVWPAVNGLVHSATVSLARPNGGVLAPSWQAPEGGDLGAGAGTSATWVAPPAGKYNIILVVSDGERRFGRKLQIEVKKGAEPSATPLVTFGAETHTPTPSPQPSETPTPTPGASTSPSVTAAANLSLQVGKRADGDDSDQVFSDPETTSAGSTVTYRIVIDNDSDVPVTISSVVDDLYPGAICVDSHGQNVVGHVLAADDGDKDTTTENGPDGTACTFTETVNSTANDTVTVTIQDSAGHSVSDRDSAEVIVS